MTAPDISICDGDGPGVHGYWRVWQASATAWADPVHHEGVHSLSHPAVHLHRETSHILLLTGRRNID